MPTQHDAGTTTVTEASAPRHGVGTQELALVWLFPRTGLTPVALGGPGDFELVLGRDHAAAIHLDGNDVSRRHAVIKRIAPDPIPVILDLGSRNGVRVNGRPVASAPLGAGDVVRVGGWVGVVAASPGEFGEIAPGLLGGAVLRAALAPLRQAAASDLPIVLEGETGTGKEIVARACTVERAARAAGRRQLRRAPRGPGRGRAVRLPARCLHRRRPRQPRVLPQRRGRDAAARRGLGPAAAAAGQAAARLEEREVQPLGETRPVPIDVRIVVAGQQPLMEAVRAGRFRADLLARLDGLTVRLPPLRQREDVPPLFSHLLRELTARARARRRERPRRAAVHARLAVQRARAGAARPPACSCCTAVNRCCAPSTCRAHRRHARDRFRAGQGSRKTARRGDASSASPSSCRRCSSPCAPRAATWRAPRPCWASAASAPTG